MENCEYDIQREAVVNRIANLREEAQRSKPLHKRDILKCVHKLEKELKQYDRFRREARSSLAT